MWKKLTSSRCLSGRHAAHRALASSSSAPGAWSRGHGVSYEMNERRRGMCSVLRRGRSSGRLDGLGSATVSSRNTTTLKWESLSNKTLWYVGERQKKVWTKSFLLHPIFIVLQMNSLSKRGVPVEPLLLSASRWLLFIFNFSFSTKSKSISCSLLFCQNPQTTSADLAAVQDQLRDVSAASPCMCCAVVVVAVANTELTDSLAAATRLWRRTSSGWRTTSREKPTCSRWWAARWSWSSSWRRSSSSAPSKRPLPAVSSRGCTS